MRTLETGSHASPGSAQRGRDRTTVEADKLAVFWAAIPHQIVEFEGDSPYFVVTLPLSDFLRIGLEPNFSRSTLFSVRR